MLGGLRHEFHERAVKFTSSPDSRAYMREGARIAIDLLIEEAEKEATWTGEMTAISLSDLKRIAGELCGA